MRRRLTDAFAVLAAVIALSTPAFLPAAAAAEGASTVAVSLQQASPAAGLAPFTIPGTASTPGGPSSPAGPADPGTGESREAKQTRVDYAPYVVGAILLAAVTGALILRRRRKNKTIV